MKTIRSNTKGVNTAVKALISTGGILLLVAVYALSGTHKVLANSSDIANARSKYPAITGTRIDSCSLCHTGSIPNLNPYGSAYKSNGRNIAAFDLIRAADSDGDGFTNLQEITALTFPGDSSDHPVPPTNTPAPTNTSVPTNTPVPPTSTRTATQVPPTNTPAPTSMASPIPTRTSVPGGGMPTPTQTSVIAATAIASATPTIGPSPTATPTCTNGNCNHHRHPRHRHHRHHRHRHHRRHR